MRLRRQLLAEEPDGFRGVSDRQVPRRESCGQTHRNENGAGVEPVVQRVTWVGKVRLGH